jgi:DNA-binding LacI/PurR family transcriptional regulator
MDRSVTLKDVASEVGCSVSVASMAINGGRGNTKVGESLREHILKVADDLGYAPNIVAQALRGTAAVSVGVPILQTHPEARLFRGLYGGFMAGVELGVRERGLGVMAFAEGDGERPGARAARFLAEQRICGLVIPGFFMAAMREEISRCSGPVVWISVERPEGQPVIAYNPERGTLEAMRHLAGLGHRRLLWFAPRPRPGNQMSLRGQIIAGAASAHGLELDVLEIDDTALGQTRDRLVSHLRGNRSPTAIVCGTEAFARAAYSALAECSLRVPADVSVIAYDDIQADLMLPSLTSISHMFVEMSRKGAEMILAMNDSPDLISQWRHRKITVDGEFIVRESTGPPSSF